MIRHYVIYLVYVYGKVIVVSSYGITGVVVIPWLIILNSVMNIGCYIV